MSKNFRYKAQDRKVGVDVELIVKFDNFPALPDTALPLLTWLLNHVSVEFKRQSEDHFAKRNKFLDELRQAIHKTQQKGKQLTQRNISESLGLTERRLQARMAELFPNLSSTKKGERWEKVKTLAESDERQSLYYG